MNVDAGVMDYIGLLPYLASALLSLGLAVLTLKRIGNPLVRLFSTVLWLEFAWTVMLLFEMVSPGLRLKILWDDLQFPVSIASPVLFLLFARKAGDRADLSPGQIGLLMLPAAISSIAAFSDPFLGLVRVSPWLDASVPFGELVYGFTVLDYIIFAYSYALLFVSMGILLRSYPPVSASARRKYDLVILGFVIHIAGTIPAILDVRIFGHRDSSPIFFALGNLFIFTALFRFNLFSLVPIARRVLVESLGDPIVTFDGAGYILDINHAFGRLLNVSGNRLRGRNLQEALSAWPEAIRLLLDDSGHAEHMEKNCAYSDDRGRHVYRITVSSFPGAVRDSGTELCKVALFRNITEIVAVERQLQSWNHELEGRIEARLKDLEQEVKRRRAAEEGLIRVGEKIVKSQKEILVTLSEVVENRSPETANHVLRVGEYSRILATAHGLSDEGVALIVDAAPLHDVGKIAVPDSILNKNGALTAEEMAVMKTHTTVGYRILGSSGRSIIRAAAIIALEHHERWNGEGYPAGKAGTAISLSGRIVCVCDVFDALATARTYKQPWDLSRMLAFFAEESGRMFDPDLVAILLANVALFQKVAARFPDAAMDSCR
ncbi:MAG: hypothetical protein CVV51_10605 [Spirochaetae bacterium HGW-Spirochaetae-7]|nr:MAG: hypothetical protein CVV51_10605 [Spirochaetae bacterium HGW-Spirochaetae-7]